MVSQSGRIVPAGFAASTGRVLLEAACDADGIFRDNYERPVKAIIVSATGGAVRCSLRMGRDGGEGGYSVARIFDVTPQADAIFYLNCRRIQIIVETLGTTTAQVFYAALNHEPTLAALIPELVRYESYLAGSALNAVPDGARWFVTDTADTWTWTVQNSPPGGTIYTGVYLGDLAVRYPVIGQAFDVALATRVVWWLAQP